MDKLIAITQANLALLEKEHSLLEQKVCQFACPLNQDLDFEKDLYLDIYNCYQF